MAAGSRRRLLPAWMGAAGDEREAAAPRQAGRRAAGGRRAAAVYCMTEAELVDVALAVLAECEKAEEKALSRSEEEEQELQPPPKEAPGSTASTGGGSDHRPALPSPDAGADAETPGWENSEDDVLKYVREIFFN
ncbi:cell cycle regulator of non-homologous end joining [Porphyrio hochstetteri]